MAQRKIWYHSPQIGPWQLTPYLPSRNGTLANAYLLCKKWHLGQLLGEWGMELW